MKHVFFVHSYITYYVAMGVIEYDQLRMEDCVFLTSRSLSIKEKEVKFINVEHFFVEKPIIVSRFFWKGQNCLKSVDNLVKQFSNGDQFVLYIPHTKEYLIALLITHSNCVAFNFIEEGLASYLDYGVYNRNIKLVKYTFLQRVNRWLNYGRRFPQLKFFDDSFKRVYGISSYSFPGYRDKHVIGIPFSANKPTDIQNGSHILVLDGLYECKVIALEDYIKAVDNIIRYLRAAGVQELYYKFHPLQVRKGGSAEQIRALIANSGINTKELPITFNFEDLYKTLAGLTFYITISSVGLYASFCGHNVYSFISFLENLKPSYMKTLEEIPDVFYEKIAVIKPDNSDGNLNVRDEQTALPE